MRICCRCYDEHPVGFFNKDRTRPDGIYPYCKNCSRAACKTVYNKYHDRHVEMKRGWKAANPEKHAEVNKAWTAENRVKVRGYVKKWQDKNPEKTRQYNREYFARLRQATPAWADHEFLALLKWEINSAGLEVDHIHPLKGKNFCGLNVPWNIQALTALENCVKYNRLLEGQPEVV